MLKKYFYLIALSAALPLMAVGCGGDEDAATDTGDEGTVEANTLASDVSAEGAGINQDAFGELLDASGGTSGAIDINPDGVGDTADSTCNFDVVGDSGELFGDANIEITISATSLLTAKGLCTNVSNCVWCYHYENDGAHTCNVQCAGAIATTTEATDDYFDVQITTTHAFTTEMEADGQGMLRLDGGQDFGDGVDNFTYVSQDFVQTNCSDAAAVLVEDESNTTLTGLTVDGDAYDATSSDGVYHEFYEITTSAASEGSSKNCSVQDVVTARCTLPAVTGTTVIDCSSAAPWHNGASICEEQTICDEVTY